MEQLRISKQFARELNIVDIQYLDNDNDNWFDFVCIPSDRAFAKLLGMTKKQLKDFYNKNFDKWFNFTIEFKNGKVYSHSCDQDYKNYKTYELIGKGKQELIKIANEIKKE